MPINDSFERVYLDELVFGPQEAVGYESAPVNTREAKRRKDRSAPSGYLPVTGSLGMRFSAPRSWPAALPVPVEVAVVEPSDTNPASSATSPTGTVVASGNNPAADAISGGDGGDASVGATNQGRIRRWVAESHASSNNPSLSSMVVLSPDFVLGRISEAPTGEASVPTRFVPAVPKDANGALESVLSPP